ncbi:MAG: hypothetical protein JSW51_12270 [Gemmatimonadota bacterium]|nr:MAG: hypothetical protein JSW51_12270 [Gemmatimonadota bacterium]
MPIGVVRPNSNLDKELRVDVQNVEAGWLFAVGNRRCGTGRFFTGRRSLLNDHGFGLDSRDPLTFVTVLIVLLTVGAVARLVPAGRASRVDPAAGGAGGIAWPDMLLP